MLSLNEFIKGGYNTCLEAGELLTKVILPKNLFGTCTQKYSQLGRRNALNITRLSLTCVMTFTTDGKVEQCRLVDGALFSRPQRLSRVEEPLIGHSLDDASVSKAENILLDMIDTAIGGRWSAKYKQPVFMNMFRDLINDIRAEQSKGVA